MANFDYTKDDVEELAEELFNDFCDNYEGLMSKTVAIAVVRRLAKEIKESDFSVSGIQDAVSAAEVTVEEV